MSSKSKKHKLEAVLEHEPANDSEERLSRAFKIILQSLSQKQEKKKCLTSLQSDVK